MLIEQLRECKERIGADSLRGILGLFCRISSLFLSAIHLSHTLTMAIESEDTLFMI